MRTRLAVTTVAVAMLATGCGGSGSSTPVPLPTIPISETQVNFILTANRGNATLSEFSVNNVATGTLAQANAIPVVDGNAPASPLGELLDPGFTAPPGSEIPDRLGALFVADGNGVLSFRYTAVSGNLQANQTVAVAPAGGGTLTGPLAFDPSHAFLFAATSNGVDAYALSGPSVSQTAVSNAVALAGVTSLATTMVNGTSLLLATSPAGVTVFPVNDAGAASGHLLGAPSTQATLATPHAVAVDASVNGSAAGTQLVAVAEDAAGGGTNGETFDVSASGALSHAATFKVGAGDTAEAVTIGQGTVFAGDANGVVAAFPVSGGSVGTAATATVGAQVTSLFFLPPAVLPGAPILYVSTATGQIVPLLFNGVGLVPQTATATGPNPAAVQGSSAVLFAL